jgi:hypothetical protein
MKTKTDSEKKKKLQEDRRENFLGNIGVCQEITGRKFPGTLILF